MERAMELLDFAKTDTAARLRAAAKRTHSFSAAAATA
jgi:hypothetical protein